MNLRIQRRRCQLTEAYDAGPVFKSAVLALKKQEMRRQEV
jgi:hypothetical protein